MEATAKPRLNVSRSLLWEYDFEKFDFVRSADVIIIRILQRGNMEEWREMVAFYGVEKILEVARKTRLLSPKDKNFAEIYIHSPFNYAAHGSENHRTEDVSTVAETAS